MARSSTRKAKHHHIYRVDREKNATYCWRVQLRRNNQVFERTFSDGKFGGKQKSLRAAITWRDATLLQLEQSRVLPNHDHLYRIDRGGEKFCWEVQFQCREQFVRMYFHDETYGGEHKARKAAISWRDAMLAVSKHDRWLRNTTSTRSTNQSGTVGVGRSIMRTIVAGKEVTRPYWYADWLDPERGKRTRRKFFVSKHGEDKAETLAIRARKTGMAAVIAAKEEKLNRGDGSWQLPGLKTSRSRPGHKGRATSARSSARPTG